MVEGYVWNVIILNPKSGFDYVETATVSLVISISFCDRLKANGTIYFHSQVVENVDTEFSGFSVPLEHSFEAGKNYCITIVLYNTLLLMLVS